jgi:4-hydroxybenzoate polyprenyltransferase
MTETRFSLSERLPHYYRLARLHRPIGILLLLWPTLWGLWLAADGFPPWHVLLIFLAGTVLMRSAGCVINDFADRDFDGHVERTVDRPIVTGQVAPTEALCVAGILAAAALFLVLFLDGLVIALAVPAALLAATYPFTKRFLAIPQAYLGIAFGFGIPMAYAAIQGTVPAEAWVLLLANVFWAVAYDTEYAMVDRPDDLKIGIKSAAITFGRFDVIAVMICYGLTLFTLAIAGWMAGLGPLFYFVGIIGAAGVAWTHYGMIRDRERAACFGAFLHNNWFGATVFAGIVFDSLFR